MTNKTYIHRESLIGYDHLIDSIDLVSDKYPPFNTIKDDETTFIIEVAVSGFLNKELHIDYQDGNLKITGTRAQRRQQYKYMYKGISERKFTKNFKLVPHAKVTRATLRNGLLTIFIEVNKPKKVIPVDIQIISE